MLLRLSRAAARAFAASPSPAEVLAALRPASARTVRGQGQIAAAARHFRTFAPAMSAPKRARIEADEDARVSRFREYLRIPTVHPNPDYAPCVDFLRRLAEEAGFEFTVWSAIEGKPVVVMTWAGADPTLPALMLNSHVDVVPVYESEWKYPPFSAHKDEEGNIFARGSQDMKCVGMQYYEVVRAIKESGKTLDRTVHLTWVPDEEIGGAAGMELFVKDPAFKKLNIGFALDEGLANPDEEYRVFYGERVPWWVRVTFEGNPGHASAFIKNTAASKLKAVMDKVFAFRDEQERRLEQPDTRLGDVTSVNMTIVQGGVQMNVVPAKMEAGFDIRIPPTVDLQEFKKTLDSWCQAEGVAYSFDVVNWENPTTDVSDESMWWKRFKGAIDECGLRITKEIFPAATDSRFVRRCGIPAIGFSPMNNTPILLHDHNEFLNEQTYLRGIEIYNVIIPTLAAR
eukprot:m.16220 g.16220  ORF g.16220 m.16220 type:complete len:456 (+) comp3484_c0_seq1:29-1396(+)